MKFIFTLLLLAAASLFAEETLNPLPWVAERNLIDSIENTASECTYNTGECPGVGWFCLNGRCVQEGTGERCWNNIECPFQTQCVNGVCR